MRIFKLDYSGFYGLKLKSESLSKKLEVQKQKVDALKEAYTKSVQTKGKVANLQNLEINSIVLVAK